CAPADVDGMDGHRTQCSIFGFRPDFIDKTRYIIGGCGRHMRIAIESAKEAVIGTKWNMNVDKALVWGIGPGHEPFPDHRHICGRNPTLASERQHGAATGECILQCAAACSSSKITRHVHARYHAGGPLYRSQVPREQ